METFLIIQFYIYNDMIKNRFDFVLNHATCKRWLSGMIGYFAGLRYNTTYIQPSNRFYPLTAWQLTKNSIILLVYCTPEAGDYSKHSSLFCFPVNWTPKFLKCHTITPIVFRFLDFVPLNLNHSVFNISKLLLHLKILENCLIFDLKFCFVVYKNKM